MYKYTPSFNINDLRYVQVGQQLYVGTWQGATATSDACIGNAMKLASSPLNSDVCIHYIGYDATGRLETIKIFGEGQILISPIAQVERNILLNLVNVFTEIAANLESVLAYREFERTVRGGPFMGVDLAKEGAKRMG